jgi:2-hydroxy-3-keto-5-methylthiopentenyl-1-phosphate phosphatase
VRSPSRILQLDFDGTLVEGDVSTAILARFAGPEWPRRVDAASHHLLEDPDSPLLIETMTEGFAHLKGEPEAFLRYARESHPARPGLSQLIEAAAFYGFEVHVVSNGFAFYIEDYLRAAGVEGRVSIHTGETTPVGLVYRDAGGRPTLRRFKQGWAEHFQTTGAEVVYVGDGASDVAAALLASFVFARDSLLSRLTGAATDVRAFGDLHDVARALRELYG